MNINFIKWLVEYADGFDWEEQEGHLFITAPDGMKRTLILWTDFSNWHKVYYPLLLQRTIEGINKKYSRIVQGTCTITIENRVGDIVYTTSYITYKHLDTAKEEALKYIYAQEKNND